MIVIIIFLRFGMINAVKTKPTLTVKKGEELYVSYGYSLKLELPWYKEQFERFRKKRPQLAQQMMDRAGIPRKEEDKEDRDPQSMMTTLTIDAENGSH